MSKKGGWVAIDKELTGTFKNINRPFSYIEAMYSFSVDHDNGHEWTYRGYAKLWQWSVGKVKRLIDGMLESTGTVVERKGNGKGTLIHFIDKKLWVKNGDCLRNSSGTVAEQKRNSSGTPKSGDTSGSQVLREQKRNRSGTVAEQLEVGTSNPNPKPKKKTPASGEDDAGNEVFYLSKKKKKLKGEKLVWFDHFWEAFNLKKGKAEAADSWLEIPQLDRALAVKIYKSAQQVPETRNGEEKPKWAMGWLSGKRWEDEAGDGMPTSKVSNAVDKTTEMLDGYDK